MRPFVRSIETTEFDGGCLCLDFTNTVKNRFQDPLFDYMETPEDWFIWVKRQEILSIKDLKHLMDSLNSGGKQIEDEFRKIKTFREDLYEVFKAIAQAKEPPAAPWIAFNNSVTLCYDHIVLQIDKDGLREEFNIEDPMILPLLFVIKSAYEVLKNEKLDRIKECDRCGWLYHDTSKNNRRRWCNMQTCGSATKTKRYYRKKKQMNES